MTSQPDLFADRVGEIHCQLQIEIFDGNKMQMTIEPTMLRDINFKKGDIVKIGAADAQTEADDSVELTATTCGPLPAVTYSYGAIADGKPQPDNCNKKNVVFDWRAGNHTFANAGFAQAEPNGWQRVDVDVLNSLVVTNLQILPGQIYGEIDQALGQAFCKHVVCDDERQILSGSFLDYAMLCVDNFLPLDIHMHNTPCKK